MPWGRPADRPRGGRCRVRGVWATASGERAGKVSFAPAHSGTWRGEFVSADQVNVEVGVGGAFYVDLVPSEAVGPVFCASDLAVLPYRSATQSGIIQVAYQLERPVLCTRVGGLDEMLTDGMTGSPAPHLHQEWQQRKVRLYVGLVEPGFRNDLTPYAAHVEQFPSPVKD